MPRSSLASLLIRLDPARSKPLGRQIYDSLRAGILGGSLAPGTALPSSRLLAAELGVSRTTILAAFDQLIDEGFLATRAASGTRVADELPAAPPPPQPPRPPPPLSRRGTALAALPGGAPHLGPGPRAFHPGIPALDAFPMARWARLASRWNGKAGARLLEYGDPAGFRPLREAIALHVGAARGLRCRPRQVVIVAGAQQAFELAARLLLDPGDPAWLEDPGYLGARAALVAAGADIVPIPVDDEGLTLPPRAPPGRLIYVAPSHQYPLGVTMSLPRRLALLEHAGRTGAFVVEDDYDSEIRHQGRPLPALAGIDRAGRVLYVGTFAKTIFPSLRLGFLVLPEDLVDRFLLARAAAGGQPPTLDQAVLADFLGEGHFARHLRRVRAIYTERWEALRDAAADLCGDELRVRDCHTGVQVVADLQPDRDDARVAAAAAARGVEVAPLSAYRLRGRGAPGLLLGFGGVTPRQIRAAMIKLAEALAQSYTSEHDPGRPDPIDSWRPRR